jgi:predicted nucleic acid-binding protein
VPALVDTSILLCRFDSRSPAKQRIATGLLRRGIAEESVRVPHHAIVEFVAAASRPLAGGRPLLSLGDALREAEELLSQFTVLYPSEGIVRMAVRGCATYRLSWFRAHLWAYAEYHALSPLYSEHFDHDRLYGTVRAVNPFRR